MDALSRACSISLYALAILALSCSVHGGRDGDTAGDPDSFEGETPADTWDFDATDLPHEDASVEDTPDSGTGDAYSCFDSSDLVIDASGWEVVSFAPDRPGRDCGTNCRQVSFAEYDVWTPNYEVWGNYLALNVMSETSPVVKQVIIIDLVSLDHYILAETMTEPLGEIVSWIDIYGDRAVYLYTINWWDSSLVLFDINDGSEVLLPDTTTYSVYGYTQMDCNWAVYEHHYGDYEQQLILFDLNNGERQVIPTLTGWGLEPQINAGRIAYQDNYAGFTNIGVFDIETGTVIWSLEGAWDKYAPSIYGDIVVWGDTRNGGWIDNPTNGDIFMVDLSTGVVSPVCDHPASQNFPYIWGKWVAWADFRDDPIYPNNPTAASERNIYVKNIDTGEERQVSSMSGKEELPKVFENRVYFLAKDDAEVVSVFEVALVE